MVSTGTPSRAANSTCVKRARRRRLLTSGSVDGDAAASADLATPFGAALATGMDGAAWRHFQVGPETDARGCRPRCLEDLHDRHGDVLRVTELSLPFAGEGSAAA